MGQLVFHLEESRELRSAGEAGDVPVDGSTLQPQLSVLIGAAELLRQADHKNLSLEHMCTSNLTLSQGVRGVSDARRVEQKVSHSDLMNNPAFT